MKSNIIFKIAVAVVAVAYAALYAQAADSEVTPDVEKALLAEDWSKVVDLLNKVDAESPSPVLRLLKGHACLALNRNNDSVGLFLSVSDTTELNAWHTWSTAFKTSHPGQSIADYYVGDSMARLGKYEDAIEALQVGLGVNQNHPLLLNAQGVCYAKSGKLADARKCLEAAKTASDKLADAHANIGAYWISQCDGTEVAKAAFSRAILLSPDFAIAFLQRAGVAFQAGDYADASADFSQAFLRQPWLETHPTAIGYRVCAVRLAGINPVDLTENSSGPGAFLAKDYKQQSETVERWAWGARRLDDMGLGGLGNQCRKIIANHVVAQFDKGGMNAVTSLRETLGPSGHQMDLASRYMPERIKSSYDNVVATKPLSIGLNPMPTIAEGHRYDLVRVDNTFGKPEPSLSPIDHSFVAVVDQQTKQVVHTYGSTFLKGGSMQYSAEYSQNMKGAENALHANKGVYPLVKNLTSDDLRNLESKVTEYARNPPAYPLAAIGRMNCKGTVTDIAEAARGISSVREIRDTVLPRISQSAGPMKAALEVSLRTAIGDLPHFERPVGATPSGYQGTITVPGQKPGGADLSVKHANWDEGDWPFKPIYGLAYGMVFKPIAASNEAEGTQKPNTK